MSDVTWQDGAFDRLALGDAQKKHVRAMVEYHRDNQRTFDDIIPGKGKGLIGLLCGGPGCGKTLTAEAVAEVCHLPLYIMTAGELGIHPNEVSNVLADITTLAQRWNMILLLDEAEVFLQQRTVADLSRNALVSIFLRQLEYFQGIMILTTNLLEQCDVAFESKRSLYLHVFFVLTLFLSIGRIHFSIYYPDLGYDARRKIWKGFLEKALESSDIANDHELDELAKHPINGRQVGLNN